MPPLARQVLVRQVLVEPMLSRSARAGPRARCRAALALALAAWLCATGGEAAPRQPLPPARPADLRASNPDARPAETPKQEAPTQATPQERIVTGPGACLRRLAAAGHRLRGTDLPPGEPGCAVEEPVIVEALGVRGSQGARLVRFAPPVTLACETAARLVLWLDTSVQPLARGGLEGDLVALRVGGGYECRGRNRRSGARLSEHAVGKALDIFAFEIEKPGSVLAGSILAVRVEAPSGLRQNRFLDAVRASACGQFSTVLGPGSDAAHADHLHVDTQARRPSASRFCQ